MNEISPRPAFTGHDESFTPIALVRSCAGAPVAWVPAHHEVHTYIDTLQVWLASPLSPDQLDFLRAHSGGVSIFTGTLAKPARPSAAVPRPEAVHDRPRVPGGRGVLRSPYKPC